MNATTVAVDPAKSVSARDKYDPTIDAGCTTAGASPEPNHRSVSCACGGVHIRMIRPHPSRFELDRTHHRGQTFRENPMALRQALNRRDH